MKGVCLVSFSFFLFFFVFNPQKRSRVAFLLSFGEKLAFSEGGFEGFEGPFVLALEGFEAFEGFEGGFEAFVLTFEALEGFLPFGAPPPPPPAPFDPWTFEGFEGFEGLVEEGSREPAPRASTQQPG